MVVAGNPGTHDEQAHGGGHLGDLLGLACHRPPGDHLGSCSVAEPQAVPAGRTRREVDANEEEQQRARPTVDGQGRAPSAARTGRAVPKEMGSPTPTPVASNRP